MVVTWAGRLQKWSQAERRLFQLEINHRHNAPTMKVFLSELISLSFFSQWLAPSAGEVNKAVERINREPKKLCHATSAWYRSVKTNKNWDKHITRVLVNYIIITKNAELSRLYHSWNNGEGTRSTTETLSTSFVNRNIYERIC